MLILTPEAEGRSMQSRSPGGNAASPVDLHSVASAIPSIGLAPDAVARADFRSNFTRRRVPGRFFAWQHGSMLLMLDQQPSGEWQLSELSFDECYGYYLEQRRWSYTSPREAAGVALALTIRLGTGPSLAAAAALDAWSSLTFPERT
jgi:hypothetical protein